MSMFQAVWPVIDGTRSKDELVAEAIEDFPKVARRHGVITTGEPVVSIRSGREVPGAGPAEVVVIAESPVAEFRPVEVLNPKHARECDRCGVEKNAKYAPGDDYYCTDCKRFAKADGWLAAS